jgi:hypothetical protein
MHAIRRPRLITPVAVALSLLLTGPGGLPSAVAAKNKSAPVNTSLPTISGKAQSGQTLSANPGTWTGSPTPTYTYRWNRCNTSGSCAPISGATAQTYVLASADVGFTIKVVVTATNALGSSSATSLPTLAVTAPPVNTSLPTISGTAQSGQTLTASPGGWTGTAPLSYGYQWSRCDGAGATCAAVPGAITASYVVGSADVGYKLTVAVTASNSMGSATASSASTPIVTGAPVDISPPTVSGTAEDGQTLTATTGTWSGYPPPSYGYQWDRCDTSGLMCTPIAGATTQNYGVTPVDVGATIRVLVTGTNTAGAGSASSAPTTVVGAANSSPPPAAGYFPTLEAASYTLPSDAQCAAQVTHSSWEPRPENNQQNNAMPAPGAMAASFSTRPRDQGNTYNSLWDTWLLPRVDGQFTGTTDEIFQWAACKWGLPDDLIRADAVVESTWFQYLHYSSDAAYGGGGGGSCYWNRGCGDAFSSPTAATSTYCQGIATQGLASGTVHDYQLDPVTSSGGYPYTPQTGMCPKTYSGS